MKGNESDAIIYEMVSRFANQGNAEAQCILGYLEYTGQNPDGYFEEKKGVELFRKSAEQGWACGQYNYAWCIREGWCEEATYTDPETGDEGLLDTEKANRISFEWFMKAALQEADKAQTAVGLAYLEGTGVERNLEQALLWLNRAAEQGEVLAQRTLVSIYADEEECKDVEKALYWARRAINHLPDETGELCLEMHILLPPNYGMAD